MCQNHIENKHLGLAMICVFGLSLTTAIGHTSEQPVSTPRPSSNQSTKIVEPLNNLSVPQPISTKNFSELVLSVQSDLDGDRPMVAAVALERFDQEMVMKSQFAGQFILLYQKTSKALLDRGTSFPENELLTKSISISTNLLKLIDKTQQPDKLAETQLNLGNALSTLGARLGDHEMVGKGIATIRTTLGWRTVERSPTDWAQSQIDLASALLASARISATNQDFDEAIEVCDRVLSKTGLVVLDAARAKALSVKANALWQYGQRQSDARTIFLAKEVAQEALEATNPTALPFEWATTMNYLANANREYAYWTGDQKVLDLAISQYQQSLKIRTREKYPLQWAQTQLDMGNALTSLVIENTEELAAGAYRRSLEVRTETDTPLEWGMSHNNLAASLVNKLKQSQTATVAAFGEALESQKKSLMATTKERSPLDWAMMKTNLGDILIDIWDAKQKTLATDIALETEEAMRAQSNYPMEKHVELHNLAMARILEHQKSVVELEEAIASFNDAITVYAKVSYPLKWMYAVHRKAQTYEKIGQKLQNIRMFELARKIYREEQTLYPREYYPSGWANLEINVGNALTGIGNLTFSTEKLQEANVAFHQALDAIPRENQSLRGGVAEQIASNICKIGGITADKAKIEEAILEYKKLEESDYYPGALGEFDLKLKSKYFEQKIQNCRSKIEMYANAIRLRQNKLSQQ